MKRPDPLSRRHLLEGDLDPAKALAVARSYLEDDRAIEAIDFLAAAAGAEAGSETRDAARSALDALRDDALERGDVFLMRATAQALGEEPSAERWRALAAAAERAGRDRDAETAHRLATVDA